MLKKNVLVLFGGRSTEHEVSNVSACMILDNIDKESYNVIPVGITKDGRWLLLENSDTAKIKNGLWVNEGKEAYILPNNTQTLLVIEDKREIKIDTVFNIIHGITGEDGRMQGFLEIAGIRYVGCKTTTSAIGMDKVFTKIIAEKTGVRQARYVILKEEYDIDEIENVVGYPCFIKPANNGSSVGISKAKNREELISGIDDAFKYDTKLLVEEAINGREVECAVLGNDILKITMAGEITYDAEFYDYDTKYKNNNSKAIIPAEIDESVMHEIKNYTAKIYKILDGRGFARLDYFVEKGTNDVVFNEINTLPGFTPISMYPMLMENYGIGKKELIDELINLSLEGR